MSSQSSQIATRLGFWSALFASVLAISYDLGQIVEWLGWMGSGGGPEHNSTWYGLVVLLVPSLLLGISFVVMMVCVHRQTPVDGRIWSQLGVVFAAMYGTLICMNYYVQLTFVAPHLYRGDVGPSAAPFVFDVFDSFTYSVDLLGYSFMSLATLFVAFAFPGDGLEKVARRFLLANGLIVPFIALQTFYHPLIWVASLWGVTLPGAMVSLALVFRRRLRATTSATLPARS